MKNETLTPQQALILRLAIGLVFGLALAYLFNNALQAKAEPALWMRILTPTLALGAFVIWASAAAMRRISLGVWSAIALGLIALVAWNAVVHGDQDRYNPVLIGLAFLIYPFLFIANELVSSGDQAGKPIAPYALYFDEAWKRGVQLALAVIFTALFWGILWLGAALLGFIGFDWFKTMIQNEYFAWPASGLAIAAAVHLGDVRTKLMQAFRSLVLGVLSWLLPVITLIGLIFAVSLCFSGLAPLWSTKAATASLLAACVALVLLVNAAYQQGDEERPVHVVLKWSARLACGLLLVFSVLAAYSLYLRIHQYGLTPERVLAGVGVFIAVLFGLGYGYAAVLPRGRWLATLEAINISLAFVKVAVFLAVLTPLADPLRLSAESQAGRLESGKVAVDKFDWHVLRFETGSYGREVLARLAKSGKTDVIRALAAQTAVLKDDQRYERWGAAVEKAPERVFKAEASRMQVTYPKGGTLPQSFLFQAFAPGEMGLPGCMDTATGSEHCEVVVVDLDNDSKPEIVVLDSPVVWTFAQGEKGWVIVRGPAEIDGVDAKAFIQGDIKVSKPEWNDLVVGGNRLPLD